jgi:hypothetical protein
VPREIRKFYEKSQKKGVVEQEKGELGDKERREEGEKKVL